MFSLCRTYTNLFEPDVIDNKDGVEDLTNNKKEDLPQEDPVLVILAFVFN